MATGRGFAIAAMVGLIAGCGDADGSEPTLPRITGGVLVTAATTTTTTIPDSYVVQEGDTLSAIAERFHVDVAQLASANGITDPDDIQAGQPLAVPRAGAGATTTTT